MVDKQANKLRAIIFDFDGTLAELHLDFPAMKRRLSLLAQEYFPQPLESPQVPALEWLEELTTRLQHRDEAAAEDFEMRAHSLIQAIEIEAAHRGALFPFTRAILQELQEERVKVAIITRNCEEAVRIVFPEVGRYCAAFWLETTSIGSNPTRTTPAAPWKRLPHRPKARSWSATTPWICKPARAPTSSPPAYGAGTPQNWI